MSKLKITKFGFIHKNDDGVIVLSGFSTEGDCNGDVYNAILGAVIADLERIKQEWLDEVKK